MDETNPPTPSPDDPARVAPSPAAPLDPAVPLEPAAPLEPAVPLEPVEPAGSTSWPDPAVATPLPADAPTASWSATPDPGPPAAPAGTWADPARTPLPPPPLTWEPPQDARSLDVPGAPGLVYAGTWARLAAYVLDQFIVGILGVLVAVVVYAISRGGSVGTAVATTAIVVIDLGYFVLLWTGVRRATFGMRALRMQVGNAVDGRILTREQAVKRWFAMGYWLSLLALAGSVAGVANLAQLAWVVILVISVAVDGIHQGLHDRWVGSAVVRERNASNTWVIGCLVLVVVGLAVLFIGTIGLIFLGAQVSSLQTTP